MQRLILPAVILLFIQVILFIGISIQDNSFEPFSPNQKIADFEPSVVDTIHIKGEDGELNLRKINDIWVVSEQSKVPASSQQVEAFLDSISGFKRTLAVATTESAAGRFKVSKDDFNYHLVVKGNETELASLYFGTSPGFKQIHMRVADNNEIITVALGSHELSPVVEQWIDKELLKLAGDTVQKLEIDDYILEKNEDSMWIINAAENLPDLDQDNINGIIDKITGLSVNGFVGESEKDAPNTENEFSFSLTLKDGKKLDWEIIQVEDEVFAVFRSDLDYGLKVSKWQIDDLQKRITENLTAKVLPEISVD